MQTQAIVSRLLQCCLPFMHAARWRALHDVSTAAVCGKSLTLTALAIGTTRNTNLRHRIKYVDRLLANPHLEKERVEAYRALAHEWLSGLPQLLIVVDWSPVTDDMQWHLLRASVVVDGRTNTRVKSQYCSVNIFYAKIGEVYFGSASWHEQRRFLATGRG